MLAGHCQIGDFAILSGGAAAHQFVRIGAHAFVGGLAGVEHDVIPFGIALGNRASLAGLNIVGLKRRGFSHEAIHDLRRAYKTLFAAEGTLKERVEDVARGLSATSRRCSRSSPFCARAATGRSAFRAPARTTRRERPPAARRERPRAPPLAILCGARRRSRSRSRPRPRRAGRAPFLIGVVGSADARDRGLSACLGAAWARSASCSPR